MNLRVFLFVCLLGVCGLIIVFSPVMGEKILDEKWDSAKQLQTLMHDELATDLISQADSWRRPLTANKIFRENIQGLYRIKMRKNQYLGAIEKIESLDLDMPEPWAADLGDFLRGENGHGAREDFVGELMGFWYWTPLDASASIMLLSYSDRKTFYEVGRREQRIYSMWFLTLIGVWLLLLAMPRTNKMATFLSKVSSSVRLSTFGWKKRAKRQKVGSHQPRQLK